jgi:hypothetical protein
VCVRVPPRYIHYTYVFSQLLERGGGRGRGAYRIGTRVLVAYKIPVASIYSTNIAKPIANALGFTSCLILEYTRAILCCMCTIIDTILSINEYVAHL